MHKGTAMKELVVTMEHKITRMRDLISVMYDGYLTVEEIKELVDLTDEIGKLQVIAIERDIAAQMIKKRHNW
jgi:hypothetical protein